MDFIFGRLYFIFYIHFKEKVVTRTVLSSDNGVKLITRCKIDTWSIGVPVQVAEYSLYYSYPYNRNFLKAIFVNASSKVVKSLYLDIDCYDDANDLIGRCQGLPIANIMAPEGAEFGKDEELVIEYLNASRLDIKVSKVVFADLEVWRADTDALPETANIKPMKKIDSSYIYYLQLMNECKNEFVPIFFPVFSEKLWQCTCGRTNENDRELCLACKAQKSRLITVFDEKYLLKRSKQLEEERSDRELKEKYESAKVKVQNPSYEDYLVCAQKMEALGNYHDAPDLAAKYRSKAEKIKSANELALCEKLYCDNKITSTKSVSAEKYRNAANELDTISSYKDAARLAEEYRSRALAIEKNERKLAKQKATLKKKQEIRKRQKRKKIIKVTLISAAAAVLISLVVLGIVLLVAKMNEKDNDELYEQAIGYVEEGRFTEAIEILEKLGNYRNADEKIKVISENLTGLTDAVFMSSEQFPCYSITEQGVLSFNKTEYSIKDGVADLPDVFDDIPVQAISESFLSSQNWVKKVVIPKNVTEISNQAFKDCTSLTEVVMHDGINSIGQSAFEGCTALKNITIPEYVNFLGAYAFYKCSALESVTLPSRIGDIREHTFGRCESLKSIVIEGNIGSVANYAFSFCTSLESITFPDSLREIGGYAFSQCSKLSSFTVGDNVKSIGASAFSDCSSLREVKLGESVESVENYAFSGCSSLEKVEINEKIKNIKYMVFDGCTSLSEVLYKGSAKTWEEQVTLGSGNELMTNKIVFEK